MKTAPEKQNIGRLKICNLCQTEITIAFRIRTAKNKEWDFVCTTCCKKAAEEPGYQYGGTWKGLKK